MRQLLIVCLFLTHFAAENPAAAACSPSSPCASPIIDLSNPTVDTLSSHPWGISDDGTVAAGLALTPTINHGFRWENGANTLIPSLGTNSFTEAWDISGDGTTIVGYSETDAAYPHAFRWEGDASGGTLLDLGTLAGPDAYSIAYGVTYDGAVIVGAAETPTGAVHAFRWDGDASGGTMIDLGSLTGPDGYSIAYGVNPSGTVIVGATEVASSADNHAFRWEGDASGGTMIDLGSLTGPTGYSTAFRTNIDGTVIVGESFASDGNSHPFRWQADAAGGTMTDLGVLPGYTSGYANATDATGDIVVGTLDFGTRAFRWTQASGMQDLNTLLTNAGVDLTGITLTEATDITPDGQFIVGSADYTGQTRGFLVRYYDSEPDDPTPPIAGMTTPQAIQSSINDLSQTRFGILNQHHSFAAPLLGTGQPIQNTNTVSFFGSAGSLSSGGHVQYAATDGLSLLAGVAYAQETYPSARLNSSVTGALALRWLDPSRHSFRPYVEAGGWAAPHTDVTLSRSYVNGSGSATGTGSTRADLGYAYVRTGLVSAASKNTQFAAFIELGHEWLKTAAYTEPLTPTNPFEAHFSSGTDQADIARFGASFSAGLADRFDTTLWITTTQTLSSRSSITASVPAMGTLSPTGSRQPFWLEYGARIGYRLTEATYIDAFANCSSDTTQQQTFAHVGAAIRTHF